jgi:hypothetical protein
MLQDVEEREHISLAVQWVKAQQRRDCKEGREEYWQKKKGKLSQWVGMTRQSASMCCFLICLRDKTASILKYLGLLVS